MNALTLYFTAPRQVVVLPEALPNLQPDLVRVQSLLSAISPGTELLIFRGEFPTDMPVDETISALAGEFTYPFKYGYSVVGQVIEIGLKVEPAWLGKRVLSFQPHTSHFITPVSKLLPLPEGLPIEEAVFLPNMETALNFVMDGAPLIGEQVAVLGQGIVGLLTTTLLGKFPLASLVTLDRYALRRQAALETGAHASLDLAMPDALAEVHRSLQGRRAFPGADLVYELSGSPAALDLAIALCGYHGRVVIGSWYGSKRANLDLGGRFHRSRIRLISSQVSSVAPELSGRWDKARRFQLAWEMINQVRPSRWITQRFPISKAGEAFNLLDQNPGETIQIVLEY